MSMSGRMAMSEQIQRLELFTRAGPRRTWSDEEKAAIVAKSDGPGTSISAVARRHGLSASQLFTWRRLARQAERHDDRTTVRFVPAVLNVGRQEPVSIQTGSALREQCGCHGIEVEIAGATVRIAQGASGSDRRGDPGAEDFSMIGPSGAVRVMLASGGEHRAVIASLVSARWRAPCGIRSWTWIQCCREGLYPPYVWTYDLAPYRRSRHASLVDA
jgi:transposase